MSDLAFPYSEARLAGQLAITRREIRQLRADHLEQGLDWQKNGAEILLSKDGLARICRFEGTPLTRVKLDECLSQKNGENSTVLHKKMTVAPPMPINTRMVLAEDEQGERCLVDVGKNGTFVFGDEIEVGPHESQQGIWQLLSAVPRDRRRPNAI